MTKQIFVGLITEGSTDNRFLGSVVKRTFDDIGFECNGDIELYLFPIEIDKTGLSFSELVIKSSKKGFDDYGIMVLCIHTDADGDSDSRMVQTKIAPAIAELETKNENEFCKIITVLIPVQMIESWMLADRELLKSEIGTTLSDNELEINHFPESISNPKQTIENAIRIARAELTKRRRRDLSISELYQPIGQKISINKLDLLPSYQKFKNSIRKAYKTLNYMQ